jgi:hypothetical protein
MDAYGWRHAREPARPLVLERMGVTTTPEEHARVG